MKLIDADALIRIMNSVIEENEKKRKEDQDGKKLLELEVQKLFVNKIIELLKKTEAVCRWYKPEEGTPKNDDFVLVNVSGINDDKNHRYDHAVLKGSYLPEDGWLIDADIEDYTVHEWCEIPGGMDMEA